VVANFNVYVKNANINLIILWLYKLGIKEKWKMTCENCGEETLYLNRFCENCKWDKQPERKDKPNKFRDEMIIDEITKEEAGRMIYTLDILIDRMVKNEYQTKKHLQDEFRKKCSYLAERFDLETGIKYWEIEEIIKNIW